MTTDLQVKKNLQNTWHALKNREKVLNSEFEKWKNAYLKMQTNGVHNSNEKSEEADIYPEKNEPMERVQSELNRLKALVLSTPLLLKEAQVNVKEKSMASSNSMPTNPNTASIPLSKRSILLKSEHNIKQTHDLSICIHHTLLMQEKMLSQDLKILDVQMKSWDGRENHEEIIEENTDKEKTRSMNKPIHNNSSVKSATSALPYAIEAFEKFIHQYGMYGGEGWDSTTHSIFLQLKQQIKNPHLFYQRCEQILHKSKQELEKHDAWFAKYMELQQLKKEAIQQWRQWKQNQQKHQAQLEEEKISSPKPRISLASSASSHNDIQQSLASWKERKKLEEKEKLELIEKKRKETLENERRRRERKKVNSKKAIELYNLQKKKVKQLSSFPLSRSNCKPMLQPSSECLDRIEKQSQRILNKRKPKPIFKKISLSLSKKSKNQYSHIPSRFFFDTVSTKLRKDVSLLDQDKLNRAIQTKFQVSHAIFHVPRLGRPDWKCD